MSDEQLKARAERQATHELAESTNRTTRNIVQLMNQVCNVNSSLKHIMNHLKIQAPPTNNHIEFIDNDQTTDNIQTIEPKPITSWNECSKTKGKQMTK